MRFRHRRDEFLRYVLPRLYRRPFNPYHRSVLDRDKLAWEERLGGNILRATAAPRGIAKTTLAKGDVVHDIVYGLEEYEVIVSAETRLARSITKHLRRIFLADDSPLGWLYGPFKVEGGVDEFTVQVGDRRPIGVLARSFGTQIRGANEDAARPTRIVVDDGERPDRVRNPVQRRQWWEFLTEDILKAGPQEGGLIVDWNGTVLHPDAVLAQLLKDPGWDAALWQALPSWPDRQDFWEECGRIWRNLRLGDHKTRRQAALDFYEANRDEMDRGADVLDPATLPLFRCFEVIWQQGLRSFLKEYQNTPRVPGSSYFESERFARCRVQGDSVIAADGRRIKLSDLRVSLRLDPIPGKELSALGDDGGAGAGDFAAIAVIGRDQHRYGYVLDVWMKRCRDSDQIAAMWTLAERWGARKASIEANGFQRLFGRHFRQQQQERRAAGKFWEIGIEDDTSTTSKEDRIASLEPATSGGWLQFSETIHPDVFQQFDDFPDGDHDDAPDAVEGAWRCSGGSPVQMGQTRVGW